MEENDLYYCDGFEWDEGNSDRNWFLHQVTDAECEEVFFNVPLIVADDTQRSKTEKRYYVLGQTDRGRLLFIAFTIRDNLIRVISARDMNGKESKRYEKHAKRYSNF